MISCFARGNSFLVTIQATCGRSWRTTSYAWLRRSEGCEVKSGSRLKERSRGGTVKAALNGLIILTRIEELRKQ
jgi:hypothetical protein